MLAEKFFLILETILSNRRTDEAPQILSKSPFVPLVITPPSSEASGQPRETCLEAKLTRGPDVILD